MVGAFLPRRPRPRRSRRLEEELEEEGEVEVLVATSLARLEVHVERMWWSCRTRRERHIKEYPRRVHRPRPRPAASTRPSRVG